MTTIKRILAVRPHGIENQFKNNNALIKLFQNRNFGLSCNRHAQESYKLVVAGGGCGGLAAASMFSRKLGPNAVAVIEPKTV